MEKKFKKNTLTPRRIGSLLIKSINGGLLRGVPVVSKSPSIGIPYTLTESQRLVENIKTVQSQFRKTKISLQYKLNTISSEKLAVNLLPYLLPLVIIEARSKRNPSTCISVTQYLSHKIEILKTPCKIKEKLSSSKKYANKWNLNLSMQNNV